MGELEDVPQGVGVDLAVVSRKKDEAATDARDCFATRVRGVLRADPDVTVHAVDDREHAPVPFECRDVLRDTPDQPRRHGHEDSVIEAFRVLVPGLERDGARRLLDLGADEVADVEVLAHVALIGGCSAPLLVVREVD